MIIQFVARRLAVSLALVVVVSFVIFSMTYIAPGNPLSVLLGGHNVTHAEVQALRAHYHLNAPFPEQYLIWVRDALSGNLGESIAQHEPVSQIVGPQILPTLELAAYAGVFVLIFGFGAGVIAAVRKGTVLDGLLSGAMLVGASMASYVSALLLIIIFGVDWHIFPVFGLGSSSLPDRIYHLTLPAISLALLLAAFIGRITRASMIDALEQEYVETARSRGMRPGVVIIKHALRSALVPIVTVGALTTGYLITGSVIVQYVFGLNGLGGALVNAIQEKDFAVVQAIALIFTVVFIVVNLAADLLYLVIDPRVRAGQTVS
jgi:peptide/nickel transport system permease protein